MSFTERDCGITVPHRHTGEFTEGYFILYFCEVDDGEGCNELGKAWVENSMCIATDEPHKRCRTEHNITEEIELIGEEPETDVLVWPSISFVNHKFDYSLLRSPIGDIKAVYEDDNGIVVNYVLNEQGKLIRKTHPYLFGDDN